MTHCFDVFPQFELLPRSVDIQNINYKSRLDQLPAEIIWLILQCLDLKSLLNYFNSSYYAFSFVTKYLPWRPLESHIKFISKQAITIQDIVVFAHRRLNDSTALDALDALISWTQTIDHLAFLLRDRYSSCSKPIENSPTIYNSPFGTRKVISHIPSILIGFKVYFISIHGQKYISGLEGIPSSTQVSIGTCYNIPYYLYFRAKKELQLNFVVDALGIRSLKINESKWSSGEPSTLNQFEGISIVEMLNENELVVLTDVSIYF